MLKCEDCGLEFEDNEIATWREDRGEFWGMPAYETCWGCPRCHSTAVEDVKDQNDESEVDDDDG